MPPRTRNAAGQQAAYQSRVPPGAPKISKKPVKSKDRDLGGKKKLGQILVDLGFLDDSQLWELLDEAKSTGLRVGEAAVNRGLITGDPGCCRRLAEQWLGLHAIVNLSRR